MNWDQVVKKVAPHVFKIETPSGWGTGFFYHFSAEKQWCCIATAEHVVAHADDWQQPIKIRNPQTGASVFLPPEHRVIYREWRTDSAVVMFFKGDFELAEVGIPLLPMGQPIDIGSEVGWLGFPSIAPDTLCFFSGNVSARQEFRNAYLIDGVSINGVSGGPVLHLSGTDGVQIMGTVSAYSANRATGEVLPGLAIAQDVSHFHSVVSHVNSLDEANRKKEAFERQSLEGPA